jgi:glutathione S-transferase
MRLYNQNGSHFASKCRIAIYEKGAPVDIVPIPGGDLKAPEYLQIYPLGKTPALAVNGLVIGESEVINQYLEEKFPAPPLLPADPEGRARARGFGRFVDLYLEPPFHALFPQVMSRDRDQSLIATKLTETRTRLDQLEAMLVAGPYAAGGAFTLADCSLAPLMFYAQLTLQLLDAPPFTDGRPRLAAWWTAVQQRPSVQRVHAEMMEAVRQLEASAGR